jgi:alpha-tubulin suppressor-like RCC1 family protein
MQEGSLVIGAHHAACLKGFTLSFSHLDGLLTLSYKHIKTYIIDGNVMVMGSNLHGQLGIPNVKEVLEWTQITSFRTHPGEKFQQVALGKNTTLLLASKEYHLLS